MFSPNSSMYFTSLRENRKSKRFPNQKLLEEGNGPIGRFWCDGADPIGDSGRARGRIGVPHGTTPETAGSQGTARASPGNTARIGRSTPIGSAPCARGPCATRARGRLVVRWRAGT